MKLCMILIVAYVGRMHQSVLALLVTVLCVDSLTVYGSRSIFVINMPDQEEEGNFIDVNVDPPPHSEVAKMARYIVHNSGEKFK